MKPGTNIHHIAEEVFVVKDQLVII